MRRLLPLGLLVCLVVAAPARAKEVLSAKVCGENGCVTSRDRDLIAGLADAGDPVAPPKAAAPFFRVRLTIGDEKGKVVNRFWTHFMPKGELIRGSDGTWMPTTDGYTSALKKVVNPSMTAYPGSRLARLLAVRTDQAQPLRSQPEAGGIAVTTIAPAGGGVLTVAALLLLHFSRRDSRRSLSTRPSVWHAGQ